MIYEQGNEYTYDFYGENKTIRDIAGDMETYHKWTQTFAGAFYNASRQGSAVWCYDENRWVYLMANPIKCEVRL